MPNLSTLFPAALCGALAGGLAAFLTRPQPNGAAEALPATDLPARVAVLERRGEALELELATLRRDSELRPPLAAARLEVPAAAPLAPAPPAAAAAAPLEPSAEDDGQRVARWFEELLGADEVRTAELWRAAREAGLLDELVAEFERRAAEDPTNPDLQVELGGAYLQKIQEVGQSPLAGVFATKADGAFDRALELDPDHWSARMHKAVSLSFWPPLFGKQQEAVRQFELLIERQRSLPPTAAHAEPYLLLGNLHWQRGDTEAAQAAWKEGYAAFPDSAELAAKVQGGS
jgi:tetratricopeptide (TPR) repeat protein